MQEHGLAEAAVVVVEEGDLAVVHDGLPSAALHEHQRGAGHLEVAPIRLLQRVGREVRRQALVEPVDLEQLGVERLRGGHVSQTLARYRK